MSDSGQAQELQNETTVREIFFEIDEPKWPSFVLEYNLYVKFLLLSTSLASAVKVYFALCITFPCHFFRKHRLKEEEEKEIQQN